MSQSCYKIAFQEFVFPLFILFVLFVCFFLVSFVRRTLHARAQFRGKMPGLSAPVLASVQKSEDASCETCFGECDDTPRERSLSSSRNNCSKSNVDNTNKNSDETTNTLIVRRST